jgi:ketopantoate reductase
VADGDLRDKPITIIGAGAIGGTIGAYLHDAGYEVTLVDSAREHVEAIGSAACASSVCVESRLSVPRSSSPRSWRVRSRWPFYA